MTYDCPLIEVSGPPRERGRGYGAQARERIERGLSHYEAQLSDLGRSWEVIRGWVHDFLPIIDGFDPNYSDEMRGIAEGAGVPFEKIVLLNARTEILKLGEGKADNEPPDGCTGVLALPEATAASNVIHAQNWDWKSECAETAIVLKVHRNDGPDFLTFTEAGGLARSGLNSAGISITANYLESDRDYKQTGVPLPFIRRKVLESESLAIAFHAVYATPKSASNNMMVSHSDGVAINFECAPDETFQVHGQGGLIVHANHWISPIALSKLKDTGIANTPDSLYRDIRVQQLLKPDVGKLDTDKVKAALFDDYQSPWSVCRPRRNNQAGNLTATVAMIVMEPAEQQMEVAMMPSENRSFLQFRLS